MRAFRHGRYRTTSLTLPSFSLRWTVLCTVLVVFLPADEGQSERFSRPSFEQTLGILEEHMRDCSSLSLSLSDVQQMTDGLIPYRLAQAVRPRGWKPPCPEKASDRRLFGYSDAVYRCYNYYTRFFVSKVRLSMQPVRLFVFFLFFFSKNLLLFFQKLVVVSLNVPFFVSLFVNIVHSIRCGSGLWGAALWSSLSL